MVSRTKEQQGRPVTRCRTTKPTPAGEVRGGGSQMDFSALRKVAVLLIVASNTVGIISVGSQTQFSRFISCNLVAHFLRKIQIARIPCLPVLAAVTTDSSSE
jgi:hypothetical protein